MLHLGDGMLHHGTARFSVGSLKGRVFEPAPGGHLPNAGGMRRVCQCRSREQRTNERFLLPAQLFAVAFHLASSAFSHGVPNVICITSTFGVWGGSGSSWPVRITATILGDWSGRSNRSSRFQN